MTVRKIDIDLDAAIGITPSRIYDNVALKSRGIVTSSECHFSCIAFDIDLNPWFIRVLMPNM